MNIQIRKGTKEDARGAVEVNTTSWQSTYKNLLPIEVLVNRIKTMDDRTIKLQKTILEEDNLYVAVDNNKIIGMMTYGPSRNEEYKDSGEIYAIYLLDEYHGNHIGKKLFMTGIKELINKGYNSMILNVLEGNKTIDFYKKYQGVEVGKITDNLGSTNINELIMYFDNLNNIYEEDIN